MSQALTKNGGLDAILEQYYRAWFRYHPEAAVDAGVPGYSELLTPFGEESRGALVCLNNELTVSLNTLERTQLDPDRRIDFDVLFGAAGLENRYLLEIEPQRVDPGRFLPINAVFQLTIRDVEPFADSLWARLAAVPVHLAEARDYLRDKIAHVPSVWLDSAVISARRGAEFFRSLPAHPKVRGAQLTDIDTLVGRGAQALEAYADFLIGLRGEAKSDFACGLTHFNDLLRLRHFLDIDADELHRFGEALFAQTARDLRDACEAITGNDDILAAARHIQARHPQAGELLSVYREQMQAAREFVRARDLATMPIKEHLDVVETPVFLRHQIPFAAYSDPAQNDPTQHGYYYVTPPGSAAELAEHDRVGLMHTCVHEAWPGHHMQFVTANLNPPARTLPRLLNASATLYEGWALYSEQLMHEQGFLDGPEHRFILLKDRLWRALRIVIDVEIHTRGLSIEAAAERMERHLGFPHSQALGELNWYSKAPTVPMGYATGWALINAVRDRLRTDPAGFDLKGFHDQLLSAGSVAASLVIQRAFGEETWNSARHMVFSA